MKPITFSKENSIYLNSNLDETMFWKTKSSVLLNNPGFLVSKDENGCFSNFTEWTFNSTETIENTVYFSGTGFSGKNLRQIIDESFENSRPVLFALCQAYVNAARKNISLPCNGPEGIFFDGEKFLFLPAETFDRFCANYGKEEYNRLQNEWRNCAAHGVNAMNFEMGTVAYFAVCGKMPFPFTDEEQHTANLASKNYLPLEYQVNGIDKNLAAAVNSCLEGTFTGNFPLTFLKEEINGTAEHRKTLSDQEFEKQAVTFWQKKQRKLNSIKTLNRNLPKFIGGAAAAVFLVLVSLLIASEQGKKQTTLGLTSSETTQVFYSGIHHMNTDYMLAAAKDCPEAQSYISRIPQISITSLMRGAYNFNSGISTPENVLFFEPGSEKFYGHNIYGITNFTLDGKPFTLNLKVPTKKHHTHRLTEQDGQKLFERAKRTHNVEYYLVHTVDNIIEVDRYRTTVNLYFENSKWQISTLSEDFTTEFFDPKEFSDDFKSDLEFSGNNVELACQLLSVKYKWIPTKESIEEEEQRLDKIGY